VAEDRLIVQAGDDGLVGSAEVLSPPEGLGQIEVMRDVLDLLAQLGDLLAEVLLLLGGLFLLPLLLGGLLLLQHGGEFRLQPGDPALLGFEIAFQQLGDPIAVQHFDGLGVAQPHKGFADVLQPGHVASQKLQVLAVIVQHALEDGHHEVLATSRTASRSAKAISGSTIQNSVRWRRVLDFSARKVGPKQYTFPWACRPPRVQLAGLSQVHRLAEVVHLEQRGRPFAAEGAKIGVSIST